MSKPSWVQLGQSYHLGDTGIRIDYVPLEVSLAPFKLVIPNSCRPRYYEDLVTAQNQGERQSKPTEVLSQGEDIWRKLHLS